MGKKIKHLTLIPASSVPLEVKFSVANYIERKERSRLAQKTLEQSMVVRLMNSLNELMGNL